MLAAVPIEIRLIDSNEDRLLNAAFVPVLLAAQDVDTLRREGVADAVLVEMLGDWGGGYVALGGVIFEPRFQQSTCLADVRAVTVHAIGSLTYI